MDLTVNRLTLTCGTLLQPSLRRRGGLGGTSLAFMPQRWVPLTPSQPCSLAVLELGPGRMPGNWLPSFLTGLCRRYPGIWLPLPRGQGLDDTPGADVVGSLDWAALATRMLTALRRQLNTPATPRSQAEGAVLTVPLGTHSVQPVLTQTRERYWHNRFVHTLAPVLLRSFLETSRLIEGPPRPPVLREIRPKTQNNQGLGTWMAGSFLTQNVLKPTTDHHWQSQTWVSTTSTALSRTTDRLQWVQTSLPRVVSPSVTQVRPLVRGMQDSFKGLKNPRLIQAIHRYHTLVKDIAWGLSVTLPSQVKQPLTLQLTPLAMVPANAASPAAAPLLTTLTIAAATESSLPPRELSPRPRPLPQEPAANASAAGAPLTLNGGIHVQITTPQVDPDHAEATAQQIAGQVLRELDRLTQQTRFRRGLPPARLI